MNVSQLRWRLARVIAPQPIMTSVGDGDGTYVLILKDNTRISYKADTFVMRVTVPTLQAETTDVDWASWTPGRMRIRFAGGVGTSHLPKENAVA